MIKHSRIAKIGPRRSNSTLAQSGLTTQEELFCRLYLKDDFETFGNSRECYSRAFEIPKDKMAENPHLAVLKKPQVIARMRELLDSSELNDVGVDKHLSYLIGQFADFPSKLGAIKEYNKMRGRIQEKMDVTSKGESLSLTDSQKAELMRLWKKSIPQEGTGS